MMSGLVAMYRKGAITSDHLVVQCLHMVDPADPASVLNTLPREIITRILELTQQYQPDSMVTNHGVLPALDQVRAARCWIEKDLPQAPQPVPSGGQSDHRHSAS